MLLAASFFAPENIFKTTDTRIQTPIDVVLNRLKAIRPLTSEDEALRPKLLSKESRLFYFAFGPKSILDCANCDTSDPTTYFIYALPSILTPHLLNAVVFGIATSSIFAGKQVGRWRTLAAAAAASLAVVDMYQVGSYTVTDNLQATRMSEIDFFYWRMRTTRPLSIAAMDAFVGFIMWLSLSNRFFVETPSTRDKLLAAVKGVELNNARLWATGCVKNTILRNEMLTEQTKRYWEHEKHVYEEREVVDALNGALHRANMEELGATADERATTVVSALQLPMQSAPA